MRKRSQGGEVGTELILEVFRLNGGLLKAGDKLVAPLDITSARWQVIGAIAIASTPETVSRLARSMGLRRQGVQRIVNDLAGDGIVVLKDNPHHRSARLVTLTGRGKKLYGRAEARQIPWVNRLMDNLDPEEIRIALKLLEAIRGRLEADG